MRAGTLIHEARHAAGVRHDRRPDDSTWSYNGAWRFQVSWLGWFALKCPNTTAAMKQVAVDRANVILNVNFRTDPGFRLSPTGVKIPKT